MDLAKILVKARTRPFRYVFCGTHVLYIMFEKKLFFYRVRDNYIHGDPQWLKNFRNVPLIKLVLDMINIRITVEEAQKRWDEISDSSELITVKFFNDLGVDAKYRRDQDGLQSWQLAGVTYNEK